MFVSSAFLNSRPIRVHHCQQRCGDENSPEGPENSKNDRREDGSPDGNFGRSAHDVRLQEKAVDHHHDCIESQHAERELPISPGDSGGEHGSDEAENGADVRHDLKDRGQNRPERR